MGLARAEDGLNGGFSSSDVNIRDDGYDVEAVSSSRTTHDRTHSRDDQKTVDPNGVVVNERAIDVEPHGNSKTYRNEAFQVESSDAPSHESSSEQAISGYGDSTSAEHEVSQNNAICLIV